MRLHHLTHRHNCESIAEEGFHESERNDFVTGVYMSPPGKVWSCGGIVEFDGDEGPSVDSADEVLFAFDIPDQVAEPFAVVEQLTNPETGELVEVLYEFVIPAEIANRYCVGPVAWIGEQPLTPEQFELVRGRTLSDKTFSLAREKA